MVIALNEGRVVADVLTSIADAYVEFDKMKALPTCGTCRDSRIYQATMSHQMVPGLAISCRFAAWVTIPPG